MEKLAYGLWRSADQDPLAIREVLVDKVAPAILDTGVHGLRVLAEEPDGIVRATPDPDQVLTGSVSVWLDSHDDRGAVEAALDQTGATWWGWIVSEAVPLGYGARRLWPDGEQSPGLAILTVFDKADGVDDETFFRRWHGGHTPLSFEIHPLALYVRNEIVRPLTAGAPSIRAFVYEAVAADEDMQDLTRFFGCPGQPERLGAAIDRVNEDLAGFADVAGLQTTPVREWIFKTLST